MKVLTENQRCSRTVGMLTAAQSWVIIIFDIAKWFCNWFIILRTFLWHEFVSMSTYIYYVASKKLFEICEMVYGNVFNAALLRVAFLRGQSISAPRELKLYWFRVSLYPQSLFCRKEEKVVNTIYFMCLGLICTWCTINKIGVCL